MHWLDAFFFCGKQENSNTKFLQLCKQKLEDIQYQQDNTFLILGFFKLMWQGNPFCCDITPFNICYGMHHKECFSPGSSLPLFTEKMCSSKQEILQLCFLQLRSEGVAQIICKTQNFPSVLNVNSVEIFYKKNSIKTHSLE